MKVWESKDGVELKIKNAYYNYPNNDSWLFFKYKQKEEIKTDLLINKSLEEIRAFLEDIPDTAYSLCIKYSFPDKNDDILCISLVEEIRWS